jgi:NADH-quinone oxidoreductase subunit N
MIILLNTEAGKGDEIADYAGLSKTHPIAAVLMLLFMFSLTGIPPTAGFVGKFYLFLGVIDAGYTWLAVVAVVFSAISAYFYLRIVMLMYMKEPVQRLALASSPPETIAVFCSTLMVLVIGVLPSYFIDMARSSTSF